MADSIHEDCVDAVVAQIRTLDLDGISVEKQLALDEENIKFPAVIATVEGVTEEENEGDFEDDYVIYPVAVLLCERQDATHRKTLPKMLKWRHHLMRHFRRLEKLAVVSGEYDVKVRPRVVLDPSREKYAFVVSGFEVLCYVAEKNARWG